MRRIKIAALFAAVALNGVMINQSFAQQQNQDQNPAMNIYRETAPKINALVHTKLDVRFDYAKQFMYGKAWITLKPHGYATDSLKLDAKGMDIKNVSTVWNGKNQPLKYAYDSLQLRIKLDKSYQPDQDYVVYIDYTAKPNLLKVQGSAAISDAKGLYFINPDSSEKGKPVQIWTQGETESSSAWFPTIDKPNQKTTSEISMTVPSKYVTLSNGKLVSQKPNGIGLRTDTWKMDMPHAPYLFMMAVGDFKIYKDKWKDKEVNYYLEPAYAPYAKQIFGNTPEMMSFFSQKLGVDFPWNKYAQIVVRDYVSGAMENTTATIHEEFVQQTPRELMDESAGEDVIAHELFHQWFGDYVTAESWSNITVNESFANLSETLWNEYKYGKDAGDRVNFTAMQNYLNSPKDEKKNLVRFHYNDKEDMFDLVSYQKGGRILNMMRSYLGEDVFFKGLNIYLKQNAFKTGEAHQLRLAMEEVSGKDMNWFFNQWYFRSGHPHLKIDYKWDEAKKTQTVYLNQTQDGDAFILPVSIDYYAGGKVQRQDAWMKSKTETFTYVLPVKPDLVNVDSKKILLAKKTDSKSLTESVFQYFNAPLFVDRNEAITAATAKQDDAGAQKLMIAACNDKFFRLQIKAITALNMENEAMKKAATPVLTELAKNSKHSLVQAAAINALAQLKDAANLALFRQALKSQSYSVQGAALTGMSDIDPKSALDLAKSFEKDSKGSLSQAIGAVYGKFGGADHLPYISNKFDNATPNEQFGMIAGYINLLANVNDAELFKASFQKITAFIDKYKEFGVGQQLLPLLGRLSAQKKEKAKDANTELKAQLTAQAEIVDKAIEGIKGSK